MQERKKCGFIWFLTLWITWLSILNSHRQTFSGMPNCGVASKTSPDKNRKGNKKKKTAEAICNRTMFFALEFRVRKKPIYLHKEMIIWRNSTLGIHYTVALSRPLSGPLCPSSRMVSRPKMYVLAKFWVDSINFGVHCKHIYKMFRLSEAIIVGNSGHFERLWCDCFSDTWSQIHSVFVVDPLLRFLLFFRIFNI